MAKVPQSQPCQHLKLDNFLLRRCCAVYWSMFIGMLGLLSLNNNFSLFVRTKNVFKHCQMGIRLSPTGNYYLGALGQKLTSQGKYTCSYL